MDFECFRLVLRSISRPSTKGFRIVHALNITRSSENHEELVSDKASCWHWNSHGKMYSWHKKMLIYSIISFVSGFFFLWTFWQLGQFRSFRYARFVLMFSYANVCVLMVTMKYHFMIGCRAHDHNLAGVVLITWRSLSLKTHDDYLFQGMLSS